MKYSFTAQGANKAEAKAAAVAAFEDAIAASGQHFPAYDLDSVHNHVNDAIDKLPDVDSQDVKIEVTGESSTRDTYDSMTVDNGVTTLTSGMQVSCVASTVPR